MINAIKSILPISVFIVGVVIERVAKVLAGIATILYNISSTLHMLLDTNVGKKLKEIEKSVTDVMKLYVEVSNKVTTKKIEENKLADVLKNDQSIVQLKKKKNDDPKS